MKLIFLHGRAQEKMDPQLLQLGWTDALRQGLKKSGLHLPPAVEIVFPYYGDLLDQLVQQASLPSAEQVVARGGGNVNDKELQFYADFLTELADNAGIADAEIDQHFTGPVAERGAANWEWVQAILKTLDHKNILGDFAIKKATYDVYLYLTIKGIRKKVEAEVAAALDNSPCVIVAHSLGTVVAYNILRNAPAMQVAKLITIGSPLGLNSIKKYLDPPLIMPPCVAHGWFNAYDERDVVALNPLDDRHFPITPAIVNKNDVNNDTSNRHGAEGYLKDAEVARKILAALEGK